MIKLQVNLDAKYLKSQIENVVKNCKPNLIIEADVSKVHSALDGIQKKVKAINNTPITFKSNVTDSADTSAKDVAKLVAKYEKAQKKIEEMQASLSKALSSTRLSDSAKQVTEHEKAQKKIEEMQTSLSKSLSSTRLSDAAKVVEGTGFENTASRIQSELQSVSKELGNMASKMKDVYASGDQNAISKFNEDLNKTETRLKNLNKAASEFGDDFQSVQKYATTMSKIEKMQKNVSSYLEKNSALKSDKTLLADYENLVQLSKTLTSSQDLTAFNAQWASYTERVKAAGLAHKSFGDSLKSAFGTIAKYFTADRIVSNLVCQIKEAVSELKTYDSILTEISKTSDRTEQELKDTLQNAYSTANKYGETVKGYLPAIQEMSRAGFQGEQADQLAELSLLAQSAGDLTADLANQWVIATDAAYQYSGNVEKLTAALDGQNIITNKNAVDMQSMAEATKIVASQAASSGIDIDQLSALIGTLKAKTQQSAETVGHALKGILMNLTQVKGEISEGDEITEEDLSKYEKAADALGVSLKEMDDGVLKTRNAITVLKELSEAYNALPEGDVRKTELLNSVGGKLRANQLDALLKNFDTYEKMLSEYSQGAGSAMEESAKTADSVEGRLNQVGNSFTQLVGQFVNSGLMKFVLTVGEGFLSATNSVVGFTGALAPLVTTIAGIRSFKDNKGKFYAPPLKAAA